MNRLIHILQTLRLVILRFRWIALCIVLTLILTVGYGVWLHVSSSSKIQYQTLAERDVYVRFDMEVYDSIAKNYWMKSDELHLPELFRLSVGKVAGHDVALSSNDRVGVATALQEVFKTATSTEARRNLALTVAQVALYNLPPAGRDGLLSKSEEVALRQNVSNIDEAKNLYQNLGLEKGATSAEVLTAYQKKINALASATSSEALSEKTALAYAKSVLTNTHAKELYDQAGIEPTVFSHILGSTLYLSINKISPTTLQEFGLAVDSASTTPHLTSMILDLRGNIGGALDFLPAFFGLFVGEKQYVFDLFHQGDYQVERTTQGKFDEVSRYGEIAILTDAMTQSTAELTASTFKKFNRAHIVGATTRGWGTVENTYPLQTVIDPKTTFSLLLVNSITLRDDNQPIEGRGVDPDVDTSKVGWENTLARYFTSASLIQTLRDHATHPPLR